MSDNGSPQNEFDRVEPPEPESEAPRPPRRFRIPVFLFLATCASTFWTGTVMFATPVVAGAGSVEAGAPGIDWAATTTKAAIFSGCLMAILLAHEMGHYLQAVRHGVPASPPYFLPLPFPASPWGTLGAVIVQSGGRADRRQMFDIAVTGPIAGLVLALPATIRGVVHIESAPVDASAGGMEFGEPLLLQWLIAWLQDPAPAGESFVINPWLYAGWVGLFVTSLNLVPLGQLDGGHVLYTLIGRRAHIVAYAVVGLGVSAMIVARSFLYLPMLGLIMLMGPLHPPTADDEVPIGLTRYVVGWVTLAFIVVGFIPVPISISDPPEPIDVQSTTEDTETSIGTPFEPRRWTVHDEPRTQRPERAAARTSTTVTMSTQASTRHETFCSPLWFTSSFARIG